MAISLGPVIGKVTATSAIILLEVDREAEVVCHLHASPSGQKVASLAQKMPANKPKVRNSNSIEITKIFFTIICRKSLLKLRNSSKTNIMVGVRIQQLASFNEVRCFFHWRKATRCSDENWPICNAFQRL